MRILAYLGAVAITVAIVGGAVGILWIAKWQEEN